MSAVEPVVTLAEAQAYLRIETGDEEALLAGLVRSATALCEAFLHQRLMERSFAIELTASGCWQRLPIGAFAVDVDSSGAGWVRIPEPTDTRRVRVSGVAGLATVPSDVPEPIRQGILRLVAHFFAERDGSGGQPPAAVTALWQPYRTMRLS